MLEKFPQSKELRELIESRGWSLYDATIPKRREKPFSWEELEQRGPAKEFLNGNNYIFAPIPQNNETLRQAYSRTRGVGPCIQLEYAAQHADMDGEGPFIVNGKMTYVFSRLGVEFYRGIDTIGLFTPPSAVPNAPMLIIPFPYVLPKFINHFKIITHEEFHSGLQDSNPNPNFN